MSFLTSSLDSLDMTPPVGCVFNLQPQAAKVSDWRYGATGCEFRVLRRNHFLMRRNSCPARPYWCPWVGNDRRGKTSDGQCGAHLKSRDTSSETLAVLVRA